MAVIQSGSGSNLLAIDSNLAARGILYDAAGNPIIQVNRAAIAETFSGLLISAKDYKLARTLRASSVGDLHFAGAGALQLWDNFPTGITRNANIWVEHATTQASTIVSGTLQLNSSSSTAANTGIINYSHKQFPIAARTALIFRSRLRFQGGTNSLQEWGFSDQTSQTTAPMTNGAFFRRDESGTVQPILAIAGVEGAGPAMTVPATTEYGFYEIFLEDDRVLFQVFSVTGVLLSSVAMERGATGGTTTGVATAIKLIGISHLNCFFRTRITGSIASTAPQLQISQVSVSLIDGFSTRDYIIGQSGNSLNSLVSPAAFTQLANYANSAAPANATLSNTAAGYTTLGGQWQFAAVAGAETDYALFGWQNPVPATFFCTGIRIGETVNTGAAVATTATWLQWGAAFNSSAVSLATAAPVSPMRVQLGSQVFPIASAIGALAPAVDWRPGTPLPVFGTRFMHIILKMPLGTATASQVLRGNVVINGFFE